MAVYVVSDIHGEYNMFTELLDKIDLKEDDTLYVLGDILDRGPHPIKTLLKLMDMPNCICLVGNHEYMALGCLKFLMQELTEDSLAAVDEKILDNLITWQCNGSKTTIDEFGKLDFDTKEAVIDFISNFTIYEEITVEEKSYLLVHAGLGNYEPNKAIDEYSLHDIIWERADYETVYYEDVYVVTGHTPTQVIKGNPNSGFVYKHNNHIAIDCGASYKGGRLAAVCLNTGEEFYSSINKG